MAEYEVLELFYKIFISIALGALIGIEREKAHQLHKGSDFAGIRTFMIISFMGTLAAYLSTLYFEWLLAVFIVCFIILVLSGYILSSVFNKEIGMTTELSTIISFIIGILVIKTPVEIPVLLSIITTLILSFKRHIHDFVYHLKDIEFFDTIKFLLIAFVILPLLKTLPSFGPINLYEIWLMVVFVSGLSYIGYILIKLFGSKSGILMTGLLGGILSSTAVVTSLANKSKEERKNIIPFVSAAAIASSTMFIRILIEVAILNFGMIEKLAFPLILIALAGYLSSAIIWKRGSKEEPETRLEVDSPLLLKPALKFGFFYGFISALSTLLNQYFGNKAILLAAMISGFADVDAITIYIARTPGFDINIAVMAIVLAATVNTFTKLMIGKMFGYKGFAMNLGKVMIPMIITGLVLLLFL